MPTIGGIHHIGITVTDIERSARWYSELLELQTLTEETHPDGTGRVIVLGKPDWSMCVGLHTHDSSDDEPFSETRTGLDHISFLVSGHQELDEWESRLAAFGVDHSPVSDQEGYSALVFRDPDNVQLEFFTMG